MTEHKFRESISHTLIRGGVRFLIGRLAYGHAYIYETERIIKTLITVATAVHVPYSLVYIVTGRFQYI